MQGEADRLLLFKMKSRSRRGQDGGRWGRDVRFSSPAGINLASLLLVACSLEVSWDPGLVKAVSAAPTNPTVGKWLPIASRVKYFRQEPRRRRPALTASAGQHFLPALVSTSGRNVPSSVRFRLLSCAV